jgi:hypothetical protein
MSAPPPRGAIDVGAIALLLAVLGALGGVDAAGPILGILLALIVGGAAVGLRTIARGIPPLLPPLAALFGIAVLSVSATPGPVAELLAAAAALGLLYWVGADGATGASAGDRARALGLPGLATIIALLVPLAVPALPSSLGVGAAALLLVVVLLATGALLARPRALPAAPPA